VPRLDHVVLDVRSKAVLGAEQRREPGAGMGGQAIGDVPQLVIDRGRVADHADATAVQRTGIKEPLRAETHAHGAIIARRHPEAFGGAGSDGRRGSGLPILGS
jgi:hypothetical protein